MKVETNKAFNRGVDFSNQSVKHQQDEAQSAASIVYKEAIKDTNPKQFFGDQKIDLSLVPDSIDLFASLAFTEGALKYGRYNWRVKGVRASTYVAAARRHLNLFWNGEWADSQTKVPHLASVIACIGIIIDSTVQGNIEDDRPPAQFGYSEKLEEMKSIKEHLKGIYFNKNPKQYTIMDSITDTAETK